MLHHREVLRGADGRPAPLEGPRGRGKGMSVNSALLLRTGNFANRSRALQKFVKTSQFVIRDCQADPEAEIQKSADMQNVRLFRISWPAYLSANACRRALQQACLAVKMSKGNPSFNS